VGRDDNHERRVSVCVFQFSEEIEPAQAGEVYVEEQEVWFGLFEESSGGFGGTCFCNRMP
jgi:hypothetical protein